MDPRIFDAALGMRFDLDVAAPASGPLHVPCDGYISNRSLERDWGKGRNCVWMNAPFGGRNGLIPWLDKFFDHGDGVAFVPDRTSAPWFWDAWQKADAVLFTRKLKCVRPCGSDKGSPGSGTALMGIGKKAVAGLQRAHDRGFGIIAYPQLRMA